MYKPEICSQLIQVSVDQKTIKKLLSELNYKLNTLESLPNMKTQIYEIECLTDITKALHFLNNNISAHTSLCLIKENITPFMNFLGELSSDSDIRKAYLKLKNTLDT